MRLLFQTSLLAVRFHSYFVLRGGGRRADAPLAAAHGRRLRGQYP